MVEAQGRGTAADKGNGKRCTWEVEGEVAPRNRIAGAEDTVGDGTVPFGAGDTSPGNYTAEFDAALRTSCQGIEGRREAARRIRRNLFEGSNRTRSCCRCILGELLPPPIQPPWPVRGLVLFVVVVVVVFGLVVDVAVFRTLRCTGRRRCCHLRRLPRLLRRRSSLCCPAFPGTSDFCF